jgi:hypothetical protein
MSRRDRRSRGASVRAARPAPAPAARAGRVAAPGIALAIVVAAAAAAAWWALRPHPSVAPTTIVSPSEAYRRALRLGLDGRFDESIPMFRLAERAAGVDLARLHVNFAASLYNACFQPRRGGGNIPVSRSSFERVAMMREAIDHADRAARYDMTPARRVFLVRERGEWMQAWGFTWEAFVQYRQAVSADPSSRDQAMHARAFMTLMQHPDRYSLESVPLTP